MLKFIEFLLLEKAPPGLEQWILKQKKNKTFKNEGTMYAIAWNLYKSKLAELDNPDRKTDKEELLKYVDITKNKLKNNKYESKVQNILMRNTNGNT